MIGFSQTNDLLGMFPSNLKDSPMTNWSDQTSITNNFCDEIDEIDEIMKHEHDDAILIDDPLYVTSIDFDLDSISDLLENQSSPGTSSYTQPLNINDLPTTYTNENNNNSLSNTTATSGHSSSDISPKFITLSIDNNRFQQFTQSNNVNLPPSVQQQQENAILGRSYPFEIQSNTSGPSDVKRFRSASMNDGPTLQQQNKLDPQLFDPYRLKSSTYNNSTSYQNKSSNTNDVSSTPIWSLTNGTRPISNSFSEFENRNKQLHSNRCPSASFSGSPSMNFRNQTIFPNEINIQSQTLYSINQSTEEDSTPSTRKRLSLVDFPVQEIKNDPESPSGTIEQHSEPDLWSDIEQNSSDHIQDDDDITSDEETNLSSAAAAAVRKSSETHSSSSSLFWQYNVQSKGPKTKRILYLKERDPHLYREFSDPVYQIKLTQTKGQTFNKLRKGDGNDVTPNPMKLYQLGKQIRDLSNNSSSVYHGIYHVDHHINSNDTVEVKKQKNKIASRACRLRKKAQHEANKLKLHGLNDEHKALNDIIAATKLIILKRYRDGQLASPSSPPKQSLETALDQLIAKKYGQPVAGNGDAFVQTIINDMERLYALKEKRSYSLKT
ncbi:unnamed protein product [Rotaria socialis]|uniref:BZIP domain-containing protein n=1 Tax=Rotaria socialis TaxID=392032 RepID=A0A817ZNX5_9BILA|nr:unnamed protein product [Rotaria socialis]CAF4568228.1 unnamed protein product [Rotaria socialis]